VTHYSEDDLVLYFYGEGRGRAAIERHLDECAACAGVYRDVAATLALVAPADVPERDDEYGRAVWYRIRHRLPEQDRSWTAWFNVHRIAIAAAAAACLALAAFVGGRMWPRPVPASSSPSANVASHAAGADASARDRILLASVADHLDRSERVLTDIMNAPARGDISAEQRWATELLDASRLYRQDAADLGEQSVATVLDDLERSLVEIVHSPSTVSAADLEQIRRRIDAAALLFKVRVLGDELRQRDGVPPDGRTRDGARPQSSSTKTS
jgi:hypothetical protein